MISAEESIPKRGDNYLIAQDILWSQFNDVNFYVEDIDQENFYLHVLKNLFPSIKINRIFPLGGKDQVITAAKTSIGQKNKVYILDSDFDGILNRKEVLTNIFYLQRYSIENYLLDEDAIIELIKEEHPKIKEATVKDKFSLADFIPVCHSLLAELTSHFLLIQKYQLGIRYYGLEPSRDCDFTVQPCKLKPAFTTPYYLQVENALKANRPRMKYSTQLKSAQKYLQDVALSFILLPGKYLLNILKYLLKKTFGFSQISFDTFVYRLAKNCRFQELNYLKVAIDLYIR